MVATILFALVISLALLSILYVVGCPVAQRFASALSSFSGKMKSAFYSPDKLKEALVRDDWNSTTSWCGWSRDQLTELGGNFGRKHRVRRRCLRLRHISHGPTRALVRLWRDIFRLRSWRSW